MPDGGELPVLGYVGEHPLRISTLRDVGAQEPQLRALSRMITCAMFFLIFTDDKLEERLAFSYCAP